MLRPALWAAQSPVRAPRVSVGALLVCGADGVVAVLRDAVGTARTGVGCFGFCVVDSTIAVVPAATATTAAVAAATALPAPSLARTGRHGWGRGTCGRGCG